MSKQFLAAAVAALVACSGAALEASNVTLDFNTPGDTQGFALQPANGGVSVTQVDIGGEGYLRIENGGNFSQTGQLDFGAAPLQTELNRVVDNAVTNDGTVSFDVLVRGDDLGRPLVDGDFFEALVITQDAQGNGFTQEVINFGLPIPTDPAESFGPGDEFSTTITLDLVQGTAITPEGASNNDLAVVYGGLSTDPSFVFRNFIIGINSPGDLGTAVLLVDNVTFSAVPEPMSIGLVASAAACAFVRRRR